MQDAAVLLAERYELGRVLGEGGMARVHLGLDRTLDRPVAIKILAPPYDRDHGFVERFRREALASARLNHPNIVTVFDSGEDQGLQYIVMELVGGETLSARLRRTGPMDASEVVRVGSAVASALAEAHARGIVHRDIKPGNVMLTEDGRAKVLDFGIARASGAETVTRTGLVMGSASYLSPEQAQGMSADERSDVYALGCVLYQMVSGRPPFVADDPVAALYQHVNEPVTPPSRLRALPPELEAAILRCLEKEPTARFASAAELEAALASASLDGTVSPTDVLPPVDVAETVDLGPLAQARAVTHAGEVVAHQPARQRDRRPIVVAAIVAALVLLGAGLVWANPFGSNPRREAREARREIAATRDRATAPSAEADLAAGIEDPQVADAYAALLAAIAAGETAGSVDGSAAAALRAAADEIADAYRAESASGVDAAVTTFAEELSRRLASGEVEAEAVPAIRAELGDVVIAMVAALPTSTVTGATGEGPEEAPAASSGSEKADKEDKGGGEGGPPPHSNAGGNDDD